MFAIFSAKGPAENSKHGICNLRKKGELCKNTWYDNKNGAAAEPHPNGVQLYKTGEQH